MREQSIILVNEQDEEVGTAEKMQVHRQGLLHRAFSVFIFDSKGRMLLQQRSGGKYHGGLLWTNTCCSHPFPGEDVRDAAERRLKEEMGFVVPLQKIFDFHYHAHVENDLIEHEYDHVFAGEYNGEVHPSKEEVADHCYMSIEALKAAINEQPTRFTSWFRIAFPRIEAWHAGKYGKR
jgi:isopentenyl-diphosphate delta-isomerase